VTGPAAGPGAPVAGSSVGGYRIEERIGRGGMAVVYRASDDQAGRTVALKILAPGLARDSSFRTRFVRESRAAATVRHRHVLPVYGAGEADGRLFIAMRYVRGGDVRQLLRQHGPLPADLAWTLIAQIGSGLDAAHARGLVHRDVKPANMLLEAPAWPTARAGAAGGAVVAGGAVGAGGAVVAGGAGTGGERGAQAGFGAVHAYLADFGVSKQVLAERLTATGQIVGTLDYIAPEQLEGHRLDGRADQYSLACVAFELLSGKPPFRRGQLHAIIYAQLYEPPPALTSRRPDLPPAADRVLARALAKAPADRYDSCAKFTARLAVALGLPGVPRGTATPLMPPGPANARLGTEPPTKKRPPP